MAVLPLPLPLLDAVSYRRPVFVLEVLAKLEVVSQDTFIIMETLCEYKLGLLMKID